MAAGQLIGLVGGHDAQPARPRDAGQERRQGPRSRVGIVEVLEDQQHRPAFAEAGQEAEDRLEHARLAPLGIDRGRAAREQPEGGQPGLCLGDQAEDLLGTGFEKAGQVIVRDPVEEPGEGHPDRGVWIARAARPGPAADHFERLGQAGQPLARLAQQPRDADPAGAGDQQGRRATFGRRLEAGRDPGKFALPPDEARARERRRHARILGAPPAGGTPLPESDPAPWSRRAGPDCGAGRHRLPAGPGRSGGVAGQAGRAA